VASLDYALLGLYVLSTILLGVLAMRRTKTQSDYFLGGRSFGKLLQTFAAFGAGTGAHEPVAVGRAVWSSGLSGVWVAMMWLFVTPIYWITAVWYRRMRHLTLGDWFVERYDSPALGVAFTLYGLAFYMAYLSTMLTAIAKFAVPLLGVETIMGWDVAFVIIPLLAVTVIAYGVLGGLTAAYWTDLIQGVLIILLSALLIPFGLWALVEQFGDPATQGVSAGFEILHGRVAPDYFSLFSGPASGQFPPLYIFSLTLLVLVGIVVHPHFIATGGGSAKSEMGARVGLVLGNFLKRLCTVGWALTALIALALLAGNPEIASDPDRVWGVAAREILGPLNLGLVGLMLACLLAAMMSSADTYMLVSSGLVVRNIYAPYFDPHASEQRYVWVARLTGLILVIGATTVALVYTNVLDQFLLALEIPILFAAPFWLGLYWRRVNTWAVWITMGFSLLLFFIIPIALPQAFPQLRSQPVFLQTTPWVTTTVTRPATESDQARHEAWVQARQGLESQPDSPTKTQRLERLGPEPPWAPVGEQIDVTTTTGGQSIFWQNGVEPAQPGSAQRVTVRVYREEDRRVVEERWEGQLQGLGQFNLDFVVYQWLGLDLSNASRATLEALRLPTRLVLPFLVLFVLSLLTPRNRQEVLDRYYVKMKTPVRPDPAQDLEELERSYCDPHRFEHMKWFPGSDWEMQRPTRTDILGFLTSIAICGAIIGLMIWVASIGAAD